MTKHLLLIVGLLGAPAMSFAGDFPAGDQALSLDIPISKNGVADVNRKWTAPKICRVRKSLTCVVCHTNATQGKDQVLLTSLDVSSGAVGSFAVVLDTGAIPSDGLEPTASGAAALVARQKTCEYTLATVDTNKGNCGFKEFSEGRPGSYGLTLCAKDANVDVIATYRVLRR